MALSIGIVGLPNVGKSTLFTALTRKGGLAANYPFATIEPNVGIVEVPDTRLERLAAIVHPGRIVPATVEFVDIAGLVKGANSGEGLGNQFLANIRETDAIVEVVRYFGDADVVHVEGSADPVRDSEIIKTELILADLGTLERALPRLEKDARRDKTLAAKLSLVERLVPWLDEGNRAAAFTLSSEDRELVRDLHLLTMKPLLYVANVDEDQAGAGGAGGIDYAGNAGDAGGAGALTPIDGVAPIPISAKVEADIAELEPEEAREFLTDLGLAESGLERLAREAYALLGLQSFFTAGEMEVKAWTIPAGARAPQAAGVIHSDFERGFIKAETASYNDYIEYDGEAGCRAAGRLRIEGKEYVVQDGDVMHFRFAT
ncbi:MAG: redox-regulated ATPase YchF [Coriobacteriales bacterium]|nr:redox-regulated ATPase YchF [Coriobacteriales bacterium]